MDLLVSTDWLEDELGADRLRIVDASYFALDPTRDPRQDYLAGHIPGALFLDLGSLKDSANPIPFMLPSAELFAARMEELGISDGDRIVLYDDTPHRTSARAWWMFRAFGKTEVALLDGGLKKWMAEERPLSIKLPRPGRGSFTAKADRSLVRTLDQMRANVDHPAEVVADARGAARFNGEERDPRPEVGAGHIPGSRNLPYDRLFNADGTWKLGKELKDEFDRAGIDLSKPLVTTCGSGVTAAVVLFGAVLLGKRDVALYDGSWAEWGTDPQTPKATGAA